jgi:hypothetical protein
MKYLVALTVAGLAMGCAIPESQKARFQVENKTGLPMQVKASMGPFAQQVVLLPNGSWDGWIYAPLLVKGKVMIEITAVPPR